MSAIRKELDYFPADYDPIKLVNSMNELLDFDDWKTSELVVLPRKLDGCYDGLAEKLAIHIGLQPDEQKEFVLNPIEEGQLPINVVFDAVAPKLTADEMIAVQQILNDMESVGYHEVLLNIEGPQYGKVAGASMWHHDTGIVQGPILCTYNTLATQGVFSEDAYQENLSGEWSVFYEIKENARTFGMNTGDVWRHAVHIEGQEVKPFIHKRPEIEESYGVRLWLESAA